MKPLEERNIAIVHDFLYWDGGAERILRLLRNMFPRAPIFTLFYDRKRLPDLSGWDIRTTFLDRLSLAKRFHYHFLPLYPAAVQSIDLGEYDLILSSSWGWSKNVRRTSGQIHLCYCYTPMRFAYGFYGEYVKRLGFLSRKIASILVKRIRDWDLRNRENVTHYIAVSRNVQERIRKYYGRDSDIIYPPVDTEFFRPPEQRNPENFYLLVSRFVTYKKIDIAIKAFNSLGIPLKIAGEGKEEGLLRRMASRHVEFLGRVSDTELLSLYQRGKALLFPQEEDFGLTPVEAQACGMPVLAFAKGGALETVREGVTGHFFTSQDAGGIIRGVGEMEQMSFCTEDLRKSSLRFSKGRFVSEFMSKVEDAGAGISVSQR